MREVWLRADGNGQIGLGHVYRLLALAEMLQAHALLKFWIRQPDAKVYEVIGQAGIAVVALPGDVPYAQEAQALRKHLRGDEIVVLDGYAFDANYQKALHGACHRLVYVDDLHAFPMVADVVINHAPGATAALYADKAEHTRLCLGLDYLLLRQAFFDALQQPRTITAINRALICIGGADPLGITPKLVQYCVELGQLSHVDVVLGAAHAARDFTGNSQTTVACHSHLSAAELIALTRTADVAIVPASTVCLELMHVGINLLVGYFAANQAEIYHAMVTNGWALPLEDFSSVGANDLQDAIQQCIGQPSNFSLGRMALDGQSATRLKKEILDT